MNTTEQKNSTANSDQSNQNPNMADNRISNEELYTIDDRKETDDDNSVIAERGYTVRNGYNPNEVNPDDRRMEYEQEDIADLDDDFHSEKDLKSNSDDLYDDTVDADLDPTVDELDNPSDIRERTDGDFKEVDDLEDIDDDEDEEDDIDDIDEDEDEFEEDEIREEDSEEDYPENDPRRF